MHIPPFRNLTCKNVTVYSQHRASVCFGMNERFTAQRFFRWHTALPNDGPLNFTSANFCIISITRTYVHASPSAIVRRMFCFSEIDQCIPTWRKKNAESFSTKRRNCLGSLGIPLLARRRPGGRFPPERCATFFFLG